MRIGVLGTGVVGRGLASRLVEVGHEVTMGSRTADNPNAAAWAAQAGARARHGDFAEAARSGEVVVNATSGARALDALAAAGADNLEGKVVVDVSNPIAPDSGMPPALSVCNTDSVAEQIQRAYPGARVVKTLNTVNVEVMVRPEALPRPHNVFLSGDDGTAKDVVRGLLNDLGWHDDEVVDLGGIATARGPEMYLALWLRLFRALGTPLYNLRLVRAEG